MKKAIVISLVALLLNSASAFVFAQTCARHLKRTLTPLTMLRSRKRWRRFPNFRASRSSS